MAVFDGAWLAAWLPELLLWVVGLVATVALMVWGVVLVAVHRRRAPGVVTPHDGIAIYLDKKSVTDLYSQGNGQYAAALRREVEERINRSRQFSVAGGLSGVQLSAEHGVTAEVFEKYVTSDDPINVIMVVIEALRRENDIVDPDLTKREIRAGNALVKALGGGSPDTEVNLREVDAFVLVRGLFQTAVAAPAGTLDAPFGTAADHGGPTLRIVCQGDGLRTKDLPVGSFRARCLGRIESWDPETSTLTMHPIAVFR